MPSRQTSPFPFLVLSLIIGVSGPAFASGPITPTSALIMPDRVFVPVHFDDNDNVQFVFESELISICERAGLSEAKVDSEAMTVTLEARNLNYAGDWCTPVQTSYTSVVTLGILAAGTYTLQARLRNGGVARLGELPIAAATTSSPDDFLYAAVDSMYLDPDAPATRPVLVLKGRTGDACNRIRQVKIHRLPNTIEVLPIMETRSGRCAGGPSATFVRKVPLGSVRPGEKRLIHVRSLNGQALNQVLSF